MSLLATSVPPVTKDFFERLVRSFPPVQPQPNETTMDEIMYGSGQQSVIAWIRAHAMQEQIVTGRADVSRTVNTRA